MKRQRSRATAAQIEKAIAEEVTRIKCSGVPFNVLSNALVFSELVIKRLFGERKPKDRSDEYNKLMSDVIASAKEERRKYIQAVKEAQAARAIESNNRIVIPGWPDKSGGGN